MDWALLLVAVGIGIVVGLTGMGGGALMTPVLVLFFGVPPLTAVSSDVVAAAFMKPAGSWVHIKRGTVNWPLVRLLVYGSVPAAFAGVIAIRMIGHEDTIQHTVKIALGIVLIIASLGLGVRAFLRMREHAVEPDARAAPLPRERPVVVPRPIPTIIVGAIGGLMVGMTSVGSGSLIIIALMALYPMLKASQLVGTDLVQAVPLVLAAAVAHLMFGEVDWSVTIPIILGSIPGAWIGAQWSSRASGGLVRRALAVVLFASGLKMLGASNAVTLWAIIGALVFGTLSWALLRRHYGHTMFAFQARRAEREAKAVPSEKEREGTS
jgi:uncharacterized membrane protein YfcA